jgi:hypothetical protein
MDTNKKKPPAMKTVNSSLRERGHIVEGSGGKTWVWKHTLNIEIIDDVNEFIANGGKMP